MDTINECCATVCRCNLESNNEDRFLSQKHFWCRYRMSQQVLDRNLAKTPAGDLAVGDEGSVNSELSEKTRQILLTVQISLQFDEFFDKNFKILISRIFKIFTNCILSKTCWDTLYIQNLVSNRKVIKNLGAWAFFVVLWCATTKLKMFYDHIVRVL